MHFDSNLNLGSLITLVTIIGAIWRMERFLFSIQKLMQTFSFEHEILIRDYCERHHIDLESLPTRHEGVVGLK